VSDTDFQAGLTRMRVTNAYAVFAASGVDWDTADTAGDLSRHMILMRWT
jgi:hypothetical protein